MTRPDVVRMRVRDLRIEGASTIEARRVAEALPEALQRALATWPAEPPERPRGTQVTTRQADEVAAAVAARVLREVRATTPEAGR